MFIAYLVLEQVFFNLIFVVIEGNLLFCFVSVDLSSLLPTTKTTLVEYITLEERRIHCSYEVILSSTDDVVHVQLQRAYVCFQPDD